MRYQVIGVSLAYPNTPYLIEDTETGRPICLFWDKHWADTICTLMNQNTEK